MKKNLRTHNDTHHAHLVKHSAMANHTAGQPEISSNGPESDSHWSNKSTTEATTTKQSVITTIRNTTGRILVANSCGDTGTGTGTDTDSLTPTSSWMIIGIIVVASVLLLTCGYKFFKNRKSLWIPGRGF